MRAARLRQKLHRERGEVILDALADERVVEGEIPFFGFRFEGIVPPFVPRATVAIRKLRKAMSIAFGAPSVVRAAPRAGSGVKGP